MSNYEWNWDDAKRVWLEEEREDLAEKLLDVLDVETIAEKTKLSVKKVQEIKKRHEQNINEL